MEYFYVLLGLYALGSFIENVSAIKQKKVYTFLLLFPMFALTAFRASTVGNDTIMYLATYNAISYCDTLSEAFASSRMEVGYVLLNYVCSSLGCTYFGMQIIVSIFIYYSFYCFISRFSSNICFSCFIFLAMCMVCGPMNVVRMYIAIAILLFAIPYLLQGRFFPFITVVIIATLFHFTASIFVMLYLFCYWRSRWKYLLLFFVTLLIVFQGNAFFWYLTNFIGLYQGYLDSKYFSVDGNMAIYLNLGIDCCFFMLILLSGYKKHFFVQKRFLALSMECVCYNAFVLVLALDIIGLTNTIMGRVSGYFNFVYLLLLPMAIRIVKDVGWRFLLYVSVILMLTLQFVVIMEYRPNWNGISPYVWGF